MTGKSGKSNLDEVIAERISDLTQQNTEETALALVKLALELLAKANPPNLGKNHVELIKENYPDATDSLIKSRALSQRGTALAMGAGIYMSKIAIDYNPLSHVKTDMDADMALPSSVSQDLGQRLSRVFEQGTAAGMSPFGMAATMIHIGVYMGQQAGCHGFKLARPLLDALERTIEGPQRNIPDEDAVLDALSQQMGISKATARQYVEMAKKMKPE